MSSVALVCVAVGAIVGTMVRFWVGRSFESLGQTQFPWATWMINAIGSFFIGVFAEQLILHHFVAVLRLFLRCRWRRFGS